MMLTLALSLLYLFKSKRGENSVGFHSLGKYSVVLVGLSEILVTHISDFEMYKLIEPMVMVL